MKKFLLALFLYFSFISMAFADHGHRDHGVGFHLFLNPLPRPTLVIPAPYAPVVPVVPVGQTWYFCEQPYGYYPYVQSCYTPWQVIVR